MSPGNQFGLFAVADDLSGAAETAMALSVRGTRNVVLLAARPHPADVVVVDLDTRVQRPDLAARAVTDALAHVRPGDRVFKKIDSLLRGNVAAEVGALADAGYGVVLTPALPVARRVVTAGVLHVDGLPLHETDAWRAERAAPPRTVAAALAPAPVRSLGLAEVRGPGLAETFAEVTGSGRIVVCDAETDADLDAIALAAARTSPVLALAGSGGLAAAVGRARTAGMAGPPSSADPAGAVLIVVGTAEPVAVEQVSLRNGFTVHSLPATGLAEGPVPIPPISGPTVLRVDPDDHVDPGRGRAVSEGLAATVASLPGPMDLVLIGGETARRVLDVLGVDLLEPLDQIHHGAVRSRIPGGGTVVTRPGSFGGPDSLVRIVRALRAPETERQFL
jgi:4-hydroxythreonine-4-phosphate dehydrogenase